MLSKFDCGYAANSLATSRVCLGYVGSYYCVEDILTIKPSISQQNVRYRPANQLCDWLH